MVYIILTLFMKLTQLELLFLFKCVHTLKNCLGNLEIKGLCILQRGSSNLFIIRMFIWNEKWKMMNYKFAVLAEAEII